MQTLEIWFRRINRMKSKRTLNLCKWNSMRSKGRQKIILKDETIINIRFMKDNKWI